MYKINKNNRIEYPSIYDINYKNNSNFNVNLFKNKLHRDLNKTKIFHVESLNICDLKSWNKCFKLANIEYDKDKYDNVNDYLESDEFCNLTKDEKKEILKNGKIMLYYEYFGEICCDIQKVFSGSFNYVGENFSKIPLIDGNIQNYIYQYISDSVFGFPNVFAAIQNIPDINNIVESLPKKIIKNLKNDTVLQSLYYDFMEQKITEKTEINRKFLFRKKNVIECTLFLKSPTIKFDSSDALKTYLLDELVELNIPDSLWKIYFILN